MVFHWKGIQRDFSFVSSFICICEVKDYLLSSGEESVCPFFIITFTMLITKNKFLAVLLTQFIIHLDVHQLY